MKGFEGNASGSQASVHRVGVILGAVVVSAVVIFSLGVMVGRRVTDTVGTVEKPPPALPTETLVRPSYDSADKGSGAEGPAREGQEEKLTFFDTLSSEKATPPALPKKPDPEPAAPAEVKAPPPAAAGGESGKAAREADAPQRPLPKEPPKTAAASPPQQVKSLMGSGRHYVQVSSTTNRQWANDLVRKLGTKGIPTDSVPVTIKGKQWYRIRVGSFPDRASAQKAQGILKQSMGLDGMVVTVD